MRILFADDDVRIGKHVQQALVAEGYALDYAEDGDEALWLAENNPYDAIVLDVMMPLRDGFTIARALPRKNIQVPILFLTAKGEIEDRVRGLDLGADDYMVKPFSVVELLARLRALLRRQRPQASNVLRFEDLELDLVSHQARRGGKVIELTNREFALLELLIMTAPRPVSKAVIIERVWNQFFDSQTNVVNVYVNHLRAKIDLPGLMPIVQTVRGWDLPCGSPTHESHVGQICFLVFPHIRCGFGSLFWGRLCASAPGIRSRRRARRQMGSGSRLSGQNPRLVCTPGRNRVCGCGLAGGSQDIYSHCLYQRSIERDRTE